MNRFLLIFLVLASLGSFEVSCQVNKKKDQKKVMIGAYYYPWYRLPLRSRYYWRDREGSRWDKMLRRRLVPAQKPMLGEYLSDNPKVIASHIDQSKRGNIHFWAVSWWGRRRYANEVLRDHILKHPRAGELKYAILYESTGRLGSFSKPDYSKLVDDFKYLEKTYFNNPNYLKINGRPVVFIYLTRVYFRGQGEKELIRVRKMLESNVYIVGDDVFGPGSRSEHAMKFDAITAYDVYGQSFKKAGASRKAIALLRNSYTIAKEAADRVGAAFIPAVAPGYNDRAVREGNPASPRYFTDEPTSKEGDVFRESIRACLPLLDKKADRIMMVTSFNEWYEDTQIEATAGTQPITNKDDSRSGRQLTEKNNYVDYGYLYLDVLSQETKRE